MTDLIDPVYKYLAAAPVLVAVCCGLEYWSLLGGRMVRWVRGWM